MPVESDEVLGDDRVAMLGRPGVHERETGRRPVCGQIAGNGNVQLMSASPYWSEVPPPRPAVLPLTVQLVSVAVESPEMPPPSVLGCCR